MSRPSNVTAEMTAALAGEKSGTGHTHEAVDVLGAISRENGGTGVRADGELAARITLTFNGDFPEGLGMNSGMSQQINVGDATVEVLNDSVASWDGETLTLANCAVSERVTGKVAATGKVSINRSGIATVVIGVRASGVEGDAFGAPGFGEVSPYVESVGETLATIPTGVTSTTVSSDCLSPSFDKAQTLVLPNWALPISISNPSLALWTTGNCYYAKSTSAHIDATVVIEYIVLGYA